MGLQVVSRGPAQMVLADRSVLVGSLDAALKRLTEQHRPQPIVLTYAFLKRLERHVTCS